MYNTPHSLERLMLLLHQIQPLSDALEAALKKGFEKVTLKKGKTLLAAGEPCNHLWYLADGMVRSFVAYDKQEDEEEKDITTRIMLPEHIIISIYSYYENVASKESIEALKDTCLFKMSKQTLNNIYKNFPEFNLHGRILTEQYLRQADRREAMLRIPNAEDRVQEFIERYGHYLNYIPSRFAATFCNLHRTTFDKIKKKYYMRGGVDCDLDHILFVA